MMSVSEILAFHCVEVVGQDVPKMNNARPCRGLGGCDDVAIMINPNAPDPVFRVGNHFNPGVHRRAIPANNVNFWRFARKRGGNDQGFHGGSVAMMGAQGKRRVVARQSWH